MNGHFDPERDYVGEMRAKIDELADGTYFPPMVAHKIVNDLRTSDPELLEGWLFLQAEHMLRISINERDRSRRSAARNYTARTAFATAAAEADRTGDTSGMQRWLGSPFSLSTGARMVLRDMSRDHLLDVGRQYQTRAETQSMMASFLQALATAVGDRTVADLYSEQQLSAMWGSLSGV